MFGKAALPGRTVMLQAPAKIHSRSLPQLLTGAAAGLLAGGVAGQTNRLLSRFLSPKQKERDQQVRQGTAHELAGPFFARKVAGRELTEQEKERARMVFSIVYGLLWGLIYASARKRIPRLTRMGGIPFGVPFFIACDGAIAPLLGLSPPLRKIPWQPNAKELGNHIAWTAAAELVHRLVEKKAAMQGNERREYEIFI
jgi:uncharacterized membrane protein YagU involved in acid resistance